MSRTYKATGINLKTMPMGESDRAIAILTREFGLIRAVAPGVRKQRSHLGGRSELFIVNELLIAKGRSLDKIIQAETLQSYSGLSRNLGKLASSQYLAEMVLAQALSEQPQEELFSLLNEHLSRLERLPNITDTTTIVAHLTHGIFHLLALAGIAPQVQNCGVTQRPLTPNFIDPEWQVAFSISDGGTVNLSELANLEVQPEGKERELSQHSRRIIPAPERLRSRHLQISSKRSRLQTTQINAAELAILQQLASPELPPSGNFSEPAHWLSVERLLRQYTQYHLDCCIRSAALIDTYLETENYV
ncbi:MAG TPA: DNA repair protein RecO [Kamptonema sp.]|nr:DNA repair protein RecO [Kamptonema sp.]